jgi:hypothetical protein
MQVQENILPAPAMLAQPLLEGDGDVVVATGMTDEKSRHFSPHRKIVSAMRAKTLAWQLSNSQSKAPNSLADPAQR